MKRDHHHLLADPDPSSSLNGGLCAGKEKLLEEEAAQQDCGMDEDLAVLGLQVKTSDMGVVAQKLERLDEVMCSVQDDGILYLSSDIVHYNPSDLSTYLDSMLSELIPPTFDPFGPSGTTAMPAPTTGGLDASFLGTAESSTLTTLNFENNRKHKESGKQIFEEASCSDYDLKAIPGKAIYSQTQTHDSSSSSTHKNVKSEKRLKSTTESHSDIFSPPPAAASYGIPTDSIRPVVLVDSQENGIQLVHALMACAEAVQQNNLNLAEALVRQIGLLAISQDGAMRKVATYFAEALARRIYRLYPQNPLDHSLSDVLHMHFYECCPYLKFAHFTANQAILEAFEGKKRVHVVDFSMNQGMQWPALMQALALRTGGPPAFRLTGIGSPSQHNSDYLQEVGWKLAQLAKTIHVEFEYRGFVADSLADLDSSMLDLRPSDVEAVAVNSVFELHKLLARPGAIDKVFSVVEQLKPEIVTIVEQEANHNGPAFLGRFTESLHYYSTLFDSLEGSASSQDKVMSEVYLGKQIFNVVACEGTDRTERHESLTQWRNRFVSAGFSPVHLGSNVFKQAAILLALFAGGDGYGVEENNGWLMLGWHNRPLITTSAWKPANRSTSTSTSTIAN